MLIIYLAYYQDIESDRRHILEHHLGQQLLTTGLWDLCHLKINPSELTDFLDAGMHGKPFLKNRPDIHFNISHCRGLVACAFCDDPVGIDAEYIRAYRESTLRKVLTPNERKSFQAHLPDVSFEERFFRFWTLKESRIKQSGTGMAVALTDFSFEPDMTAAFHQPKSSVPELSFWQWKLKDSHILSVCTSGKHLIPEIRYL